MKLYDIDTPALVLDGEKFRKNAEAMKELLSRSSLSLRPHYKSHKCAAIARLQIENGAIGMTCAKLSEALDLCENGISDILIANQIVGDGKIARLSDLAKRCRLTVCVDNAENASALSRAMTEAGATLHCLVEYEIGMKRCGVTEKEEVLALARQIESSDGLAFDGIQAYAGHISHTVSEDDRCALTEENSKRLRELISYLNENGITVKTLSGGSTGTSVIKAEEGLYTELQAGSYLFMDSTYRALCLPFESSLFLLTSVVSVRDGLAVVDAGVKTCGVDQGAPVPVGFEVGEVVCSEEHLQLHDPSRRLELGEKLLMIPGHCCSTVNLHDKIYLTEGDTVADILTVTGRGFGK